MYMAWPAVPATHPDAPALELLSWVLDNGRGSRLADAVYYRSNLASGVHAMFYGMDVGGLFVVRVTTERPRLAKAVRRTHKVLEGLRKRPVTADELARAKAMVAESIASRLDEPEARAELLAECMVAEGKADCARDRWERMQAVSAADIERVLDLLGPDTRTTLSVVPRGQGGALEGAAPVELP